MSEVSLDPLRICLVEDDQFGAAMVARVLGDFGHSVDVCVSAEQALAEIPRMKPDLVISDIMLGSMDGIELCESLLQEMADLKVIILTAKSYDYDRERARKAGAAGFIVKPINPATFPAQLRGCIEESLTIRYWGVRGTLPVPGQRSVKYGGNTSCVSLQLPKQRNFVFDAGSGIKELSNDVLGRRKGKWSAKMFITHPHWDHINAFPFFVPLYIPGNEFEIIGSRHGSKSMRELISAQMEDVYFPVTIKEMGARIYFRDIEPGTHDVDGVEVKSMYLSHPGKCLGYRVNYGGVSFSYITDNEIYPADSPGHNPNYETQLIKFISDSDIAVMDSCYFDDEYRRKVNWGHSSVNEVVRIAHAAGVRELQLFHHDPDQDDAKIDRKFEIATQLLASWNSSTRCSAPKEGDALSLKVASRVTAS